MYQRMFRFFSIGIIVTLLLGAAGQVHAASGAMAPRSSVTKAKVDRSVSEKIKKHGKAGFWVVFGQQADLSAAASIPDWTARGQYVVDQLQKTADESQHDIRRMLDERRTPFQSFWVRNAIHVKKGDQAVLDLLATQRGVVSVEDERTIALPLVDSSTRLRFDLFDPQWGIKAVRAPEAWSTYNVRGEGVVVASIDTGVDYNHPALVRQYRGRLVNGSFDHNYNWFDPSKVCAPAGIPCDNHKHGTHVTGTMVGDDGAANKIGVAPAAKWIAAKGCEVANGADCTDVALLASGQWMLAPTDLGGNNPRPDLRPHVINNSWGSEPGETFYKDIVRAWIASGIFPIFSNGNAGPNCQTANAPGNYVETYSVGSYNDYGWISDFSSRGASSLDNVVKPNIAAPGERIRSAVPNAGYDSMDGTSMAAPHVAGAVALLWSASSSLMGDINATRAVLDQSAVDTNDTYCGGTAAKNNVWGEGKLDVFAALGRVARDTNRGTLTGRFTAAGTGQAIVGATIAATGPLPQKDNRTATAAADGSYSLRLPPGTYDVKFSAWGYNTVTLTSVPITAGTITSRSAQLTAVPRYTVSGRVFNTVGAPLAGLTVRTGHPSIPAVKTNASGYYSLPGVPVGTHVIMVEADRCHQSGSKTLAISTNTQTNFSLIRDMDAFGYTCQVVPSAWVSGQTKLALPAEYESKKLVTLPFAFRYYGKSYTSAYVTSDGYLSFLNEAVEEWNTWAPDWWAPNGAIFAMWDEFSIDASAGVYTTVTGTAPNRQFIVEWRNVKFRLDSGDNRARFALILHENGQIRLQYADIGTTGRDRGDSATVAIENADGTLGFEYSFNEPVLSNGSAIRFIPPVQNLLKNASFELDSTYDYRPDNWTPHPSFGRGDKSWDGDPVRFGSYSGEHSATVDTSYVVSQLVPGMIAGQKYSFAGWVNIEPTSDTFSFQLDVQWRNTSNALISTQTIKRYSGRTYGWDEAVSSNLVAPAGATRAQVRMVVNSLKGRIYVEDFIFGK